MSINLYASISCDWMDQAIDRLVYQEDEAGLKRLNQALENAQAIWDGWALEFDATVLCRGITVRIKFPAEHLSDIPGLRKQFAQAIDNPVSVGVGTSLDDAERAQEVALHRGGDQMVLWTPELGEELEESQELSKAFKAAAFRHLKTGEIVDTGAFHDLNMLPGGEDDIGNYESGFLDDAGHFFNRAQARAKTHQSPQSETLLGGLGQVKKNLKKANEGPGSPGPGESPETTAQPNKPSAGGGISYRQQPNQGGVPQPPMAEASEHSQGEAMRSLADETSSPEGSGVAEDFEGALHDHAQEQDKKDKDAEEAANGKAEARKKVVEILTQVKQFAPQLETLKEQAPDLYGAVIGLVQALMITGQGLLEGQESDSEKVVDQKGEESSDKGDTSGGGEVSKSELQKAWPRSEQENQEAQVAQDQLESREGSQELGVKSTLPLRSQKWEGSRLSLDMGPGGKPARLDAMRAEAAGIPPNAPPVTNRAAVSARTASVPQVLDPSPLISNVVPGKETAVGYKRSWQTRANENNPERYGPSLDVAHYGGKHPDWSKHWADKPMDNPGETGTENTVWSGVADRALDAAVPFPAWPANDGRQLHFKWQTLGPDATHHALSVYARWPEAWTGSKWLAWLPVNKQTGQVDMNYRDTDGSAPRLDDEYQHLPELINEHLKDKTGLIKSESLEKAETPEQVYDPMKFDPQVLAAATDVELEHTSDRYQAQKIALEHLTEDPNYYQKLKGFEKEELSKGKLPLPENQPRHTHIELPIGATKDSKIKVKDPEEGGESGRTHWVSVRAGQVLSNSGHPISSRNPSGK